MLLLITTSAKQAARQDDTRALGLDIARMTISVEISDEQREATLHIIKNLQQRGEGKPML